MSSFKFCGCKGFQHAITREQRAYCTDALAIAYATRDRAAIANIRAALNGCPTRTVSNGGADEALNKTAAAIIRYAEINGANIVHGGTK